MCGEGFEARKGEERKGKERKGKERELHLTMEMAGDFSRVNVFVVDGVDDLELEFASDVLVEPRMAVSQGLGLDCGGGRVESIS